MIFKVSIVIHVFTKKPCLHSYMQARSQAEARMPGLQHHMGIDMRNPDFSWLQTTKAQASLRIRAVWSAPYHSLSEE